MADLPLQNRHDRRILDLAVPALAGLAADPLTSLCDTAFVGQLGKIPLGALGVNASIFAMAFVVFNFLAYGTTPQVGRALGDDEPEEAGRVVTQALTLAVIAGVVALAALQLFAGPLLTLMGATGELRAPAETYLRIRAFAGPAVLIINASRGALRGFQDTRTPMAVTLGLNLVNLVLDPLLIFGLGWGLAGAAIATAVAQWTGALGFVYLLLVRRRRELNVPLEWPNPRELLPFVKIGGEMLIRTASLIGTMALATAVAARIGSLEVAAHQVANQMWMFLALVVDALAVAGQAMVSERLGQQKPDEAREVADRLLWWGLGVGIALCVGFLLLSPVLPALFSDDPAVRAQVADIFIFVALLQPLNGLVFVWDGIFMGSSHFGFLARAMLASGLVAAAVLLLVRPMGWGLSGVWWGITTLMITRLMTLVVPYFRWWPEERPS